MFAPSAEQLENLVLYMPKSEDFDEIPRNGVFHQDPHCLPRVNEDFNPDTNINLGQKETTSSLSPKLTQNIKQIFQILKKNTRLNILKNKQNKQQQTITSN